MKKLPPIPRFIHLPAGKIPVKRVKGLHKKEKCMGKFDFFARTISLEATLGLVAAHLTLEHERVHAILMDAGVNELLSDEIEERICDCLAQDAVARMQK